MSDQESSSFLFLSQPAAGDTGVLAHSAAGFQLQFLLCFGCCLTFLSSFSPKDGAILALAFFQCQLCAQSAHLGEAAEPKAMQWEALI